MPHHPTVIGPEATIVLPVALREKLRIGEEGCEVEFFLTPA